MVYWIWPSLFPRMINEPFAVGLSPLVLSETNRSTELIVKSNADKIEKVPAVLLFLMYLLEGLAPPGLTAPNPPLLSISNPWVRLKTLPLLSNEVVPSTMVPTSKVSTPQSLRVCSGPEAYAGVPVLPLALAMLVPPFRSSLNVPIPEALFTVIVYVLPDPDTELMVPSAVPVVIS